MAVGRGSEVMHRELDEWGSGACACAGACHGSAPVQTSGGGCVPEVVGHKHDLCGRSFHQAGFGAGGDRQLHGIGLHERHCCRGQGDGGGRGGAGCGWEHEEGPKRPRSCSHNVDDRTHAVLPSDSDTALTSHRDQGRSDHDPGRICVTRLSHVNHPDPTDALSLPVVLVFDFQAHPD